MRAIPTVAYEAMIVLGQSAAADLASSVAHVREILSKNGAEIVALKKWADRQFAYPIKKQKRGTYLLAYFQAPTDKLADIERGFNLSETVLRQLVVRADHLSVDEMKAADGQLDLMIESNLRAASLPSTPVPAAAAPAPAGEPA
jgi:small subunit ribosomal protein S6